MAQVGQRVRIDIGPLRDIEGLVLRTSQGHRLLVSITLLQRSVAVEIDADWVSIPPEALFGSDAVTPPTLNYT